MTVITINNGFYGVTHLTVTQKVCQVLIAGHRVSVQTDEDVPGGQPLLGGITALNDCVDKQSSRQMVIMLIQR